MTTKRSSFFSQPAAWMLGAMLAASGCQGIKKIGAPRDKATGPPPVTAIPDTVKVSKEGATQSPEAMKAFKKGTKTLRKIRSGGQPKHQEAIAAFKEALAADGRFAEAWYNLGVVYEDLRKLRDAEECYVKASSLKPTFTEASVALGRTLLTQRKPRQARALYNRLLKQEPNNARYRIQLVHIDRLQKNYAAAEKQIQKTLFREPENVEAMKALALIYKDQGKYDLAKLISSNALKLRPNDPEIYNNLGLIYLKEQQTGKRTDGIQQAVQQFSKALEISAGYKPALMNLTALALEYKDYETADRTSQKVLSQRPADVEALNTRAIALRGKGQNDDAKALYEKLIEIDPSNPEPLFNLGVLYAMGYQDYKKALEYYQSYLDKSSVTPDRRVRVAIKAAEGKLREEQKRAEMERKMREQEEKLAAEAKRRREEEQRRMKEEMERAEKELIELEAGLEEKKSKEDADDLEVIEE